MNLDSKLRCKCGKEKGLFEFLVNQGFSRSQLTTNFETLNEKIDALLPRLRCNKCNRKGSIYIVETGVDKKVFQKSLTRTPFSKRLVATDRGVNRIFHKQSCGKAKMIRREDEIFFDTREEAVRKRFDPCKYCKP
ncbi:hypothetical protein N9M53_02255 [Alphaproteobacteria bacterium]|nr:hypothetical protein [Alphaproteobacteria bacterium]